jgi:hypothetical protein
MKYYISMLAWAFLIAPFALAEPAASVATKDEIPALVKQLGDDSPKVREEASQKLRHFGGEALPALKEALQNDDPEVLSRAQIISKQIDEDLHPKVRADSDRSSINLGGFGPGGFGAGGRMQIQVTSTMMIGNGKYVSISKTNDGKVKETTVKEDGKTTKIHEDASGISVAITETKDGKEVTQTSKAKDRDELKKDNPKVFEIYENLSKDDVRLNSSGVQIRGRVGNADNFAEVRKSIEESQKRAQEEIKRAQKEIEQKIEEVKPREEQPKK